MPTATLTPVLLTPALDPLETFLEHCHQRHYTSKSMIICAGDPCESLFFIVQGSVTILLEQATKNEMIVGYLNQGNFFGEMGLFNCTSTQRVRSAGVQAKTACIIAEISYIGFHELLLQHPDMLYILCRQMADNLRNTTRKAADLAFLDTGSRVARALLTLAQHPDAITHPEGMQIKISRQDIGRIVGCSREVAGRVLKSLEEQNLIKLQGHSIVIYDVR